MSAYREAVMADAPSAFFRLSESSGTSALNEVGGTGAQAPPAGTYIGTPTLGVKNAIAHTNDRAVTLNGTGAPSQYVSVPDNANVNLGDTFTIELWIKRAAWGAAKTLVSKGTTAPRVAFDATNHLLLSRGNTGTLFTTVATFTNTGWMHIVVTKATTTTAIYVNGVKQSITGSDTPMVNTASALFIGAFTGPSELFNGTIDEVAFYKTALSAAQVAAHYRAGTKVDDFPDLVVELALESNPLDAVQLWRNYTEFVRAGSTQRGRGEELQTIEAGSCSVTFDNHLSQFDPFNTSSPYNGTLKPGKMIRVSFDWNKVRYPIFTGYVDGWSPSWAPGPDSTIEVTAADGLAKLAGTAFPAPAAPVLMATWFNGSGQVFTDGSAFTAPNYARTVWAEVASTWLEDDTTVEFRYANQDGASDYRLATAQVAAGTLAGTRLPLNVMDGDYGVRDITGALSNNLSNGTVKVYGVQETFPPVLSGARVTAILDAIGWPAGSAWRSIDTGWSIITGFTPEPEESPLTRLQATARAELGDFLMLKTGQATFHDRHHRWVDGTLKGTFGDGTGATEFPYVGLVPEFDYKRVRNDIQITAEGNPSPDRQLDTASVTAYGGRYVYSDTVAVQNKPESGFMAIQLRTWLANPDERFNSIEVIPRPINDAKAIGTLALALALEFGDMIEVVRRPPGGTMIKKTCRVEGLSTSFGPRHVSLGFQLSPYLSNPWY